MSFGGFGKGFPGQRRGSKDGSRLGPLTGPKAKVPVPAGPKLGAVGDPSSHKVAPIVVGKGKRPRGRDLGQTPPRPRGPRIETPPERRHGIAIVGKFRPWHWGQYPDEAYFADAIQSLGIPVYRVDQETSAEPVTQAEWAIFTGQPASFQKIPEWSPTHKTALWTLDWLPTYPDRRPTIDAAKRATIFVSSDRYDWRSKYGIEHHFYMPGACESVEPAFKPKPVRKCAFMGSIYNDRRKVIAETVKKAGGVVLSRPGEWLYGLNLARFVQETKVIVGDNVLNDIPGYWSTRNYIIPGAGGFLLTPPVPGLDRDLVAGEHVAVYGSLERLGEAIEFCASNDPAREEIRRKGFVHVRKHHNWAVRAAVLIERLGVKKRAGMR